MMELITLNGEFQPDKLVESYESLIWSERYSSNGDFELRTPDISNAVNSLPRGTVVSLRESNVPMIVEDYIIEKPTRNGPIIKVVGRSFETVLENRVSVNSLPSDSPRAPWSVYALKPSDAAYLVMRTVLGDDARLNEGLVEILPVITPAVSPLDAIPEIDLTLPADFSTPEFAAVEWFGVTGGYFVFYPTGSYVTYEGTLYKALTDIIYIYVDGTPPPDAPDVWDPVPNFNIEAKDLYSAVMDLVSTNHHALKAVRPVLGKSKIGIEIYNGVNLSSLFTFNVTFDQIEDSKYLLSDRGSRNVAYAYGDTGSQIVLKTAAAEPAGLDRKVLLVDGVSEDPDNVSDSRRSQSLVELYKYNATALFDGKVSDQLTEGFNRYYFLGDIIKLVGEYGLSEYVRVAEFIRSSDATGEKSYPTFEAVS